MKGLGRSDLRSPLAECEMTGAEYRWLKEHPKEVPPHMRDAFEKTLAWERRHEAGLKAAATKRRRYKKWPTRKGDHK